MNHYDYYKAELATKKTNASKKGFLTKSEKAVQSHLNDLLEAKKEGAHGNMKYAYLYGEPVTHIRISRVKTELKVIQNLKKSIETMKNQGLKKPSVRGLKTLCSHVVKATGLKVDGTLKKGFKYIKGGKVVKTTPTPSKAKKVCAKKPVAKKKTVVKKKPAAKKPTAKTKK
jgi:hypothetical protein